MALSCGVDIIRVHIEYNHCGSSNLYVSLFTHFTLKDNKACAWSWQLCFVLVSLVLNPSQSQTEVSDTKSKLKQRREKVWRDHHVWTAGGLTKKVNGKCSGQIERSKPSSMWLNHEYRCMAIHFKPAKILRTLSAAKCLDAPLLAWQNKFNEISRGCTAAAAEVPLASVLTGSKKKALLQPQIGKFRHEI